MNYPALVISVLALLFTLFSFWWMNWRTGKLHVGPPRSYAAFGSKDAKMVLEFPLVLFNDGPMPIVIQNLRLIFLHEIHPRPLHFAATVKKLGKDEERSFATQFPVRGREAVLLICEFQREPGGMIFEARSYTLELQAKVGEDYKWKKLCSFPFNVSEKSLLTINRLFTVHDNLADG